MAFAPRRKPARAPRAAPAPGPKSLGSGDWKPLFCETSGLAISPRSDDGDVGPSWSCLELGGGRYEGLVTGEGRKASLGVERGPAGEQFAGKFARERPCGPGQRRWADGSTCLGAFAAGTADEPVLHGLGIFERRNGDLLAGDWRDGKLHGRGVQRAAANEQGSTYVGTYSAGERCGSGVYSFADGSEYSGQFQADEAHGYGAHRAGGSRYLGAWSGGERHGCSVFTARGASWAGRWARGRLEWSAPLPVRGQQPPGGVEADAGRLRACWRAAQLARAASELAGALAEAQCDPAGELQTELEQARADAQAAAAEAEAAARKARALRPLTWALAGG